MKLLNKRNRKGLKILKASYRRRNRVDPSEGHDHRNSDNRDHLDAFFLTQRTRIRAKLAKVVLKVTPEDEEGEGATVITVRGNVDSKRKRGIFLPIIDPEETA